LTLPMEMPGHFARLLVMNTILPTGDAPLGKGFLDWRAYSNSHPDMAVGKLLARSCPHLSPTEAAAYDAPYPDASYKAGVRRFPVLVPEFIDSPGAAGRSAREFWRNEWQGQSVMAIGMADPVLTPATMRALHRDIRGCPAPLEFAGVGHFLQEWGEQIAAAAITAMSQRQLAADFHVLVDEAHLAHRADAVVRNAGLVAPGTNPAIFAARTLQRDGLGRGSRVTATHPRSDSATSALRSKRRPAMKPVEGIAREDDVAVVEMMAACRKAEPATNVPFPLREWLTTAP
jgi:hypothetical protein